jgi:hypothetical protein
MGGRGATSGAVGGFGDVDFDDMQKYQLGVSQADRDAIENTAISETFKREATDWDRAQNPEKIDKDGMISFQIDKWSNTSAYVNAPGAVKINKALREEKVLTGKLKKAQEALDRNMKPLPKNINLYRNVSSNYLKAIGFDPKNPNSISGLKVSEKAFMSTSTNLSSNIFNSRTVVMKIQAPKGIKAFITKNTAESEIVLSRNSSYTITGVSKVKGGWQINVRMN